MLVRGKAFGPKFLLQFRSALFEGNRSREDERCRHQIVAHLLSVDGGSLDLYSIKATTIAKKEKGDEASQNGGGRGGGGGEGGLV